MASVADYMTAAASLPKDGTAGALAGRVWLPEVGGPAVAAVRADGVLLVKVRDGFQVPAGAEGTALAPEHGDIGFAVSIELLEGRSQRVGACRIHGVARLGAAVDHGPDAAGFFDAHAHDASWKLTGRAASVARC